MKYAADEAAFHAWRTAVQAKDEIAIYETSETLYRVLRRYATSIVYSVLRRRDQDLVTDIVAHAFEKAHQFKGDSKFTTWFYRLAYHMCLRELERRKARAEVSLENLRHLSLSCLESQALARIGLERLSKRLSPEELGLLNLKLIGLEEKDIACALKIGKKAVNQRWLRLRRKLQSLSYGR
jgi:RNA polymerase sigma-70 factor (ECF subfamily)